MFKHNELGSLPQVVLGATGLRVSAVGLGCSRLGSILAGSSADAAVRLVQHAFRQGITLFDTADIYGQGESERILRRALEQSRNRVTLVTKGGQRFPGIRELPQWTRRCISFLSQKVPAFHDMLAAKRAGPLPRDYTAAYLHRALEKSLRRLGTDYVDLYLLHSPTGTEIQKSDSFAMLERAKEKGLVRHWGISCEDLSAVDAALRIDGIGALEVPLCILYPESGPKPAAVVDSSLRKIGLIVGQILSSRNEVVPTARTPKERIELVLSHSNAAAVVRTASTRHLDEWLLG